MCNTNDVLKEAVDLIWEIWGGLEGGEGGERNYVNIVYIMKFLKINLIKIFHKSKLLFCVSKGSI